MIQINDFRGDPSDMGESRIVCYVVLACCVAIVRGARLLETFRPVQCFCFQNETIFFGQISNNAFN